MTRLAQAMSKTWHKIHIALVNQPKDLDRKLRLTSPMSRRTVAPKAKGIWTHYSVT